MAFNVGDTVRLNRPIFNTNKGVEGVIEGIINAILVIKVTKRPTSCDAGDFLVGDTARVDLDRCDLVTPATPVTPEITPYSEIKHEDIQVGDEILSYHTAPVKGMKNALRAVHGVIAEIKHETDLYTKDGTYLGNKNFDKYLIVSRSPQVFDKGSDFKEGTVAVKTAPDGRKTFYTKYGVNQWIVLYRPSDRTQTVDDEYIDDVFKRHAGNITFANELRK